MSLNRDDGLTDWLLKTSFDKTTLKFMASLEDTVESAGTTGEESLEELKARHKKELGAVQYESRVRLRVI